VFPMHELSLPIMALYQLNEVIFYVNDLNIIIIKLVKAFSIKKGLS
jgi:hypothetical protein